MSHTVVKDIISTDDPLLGAAHAGKINTMNLMEVWGLLELPLSEKQGDSKINPKDIVSFLVTDYFSFPNDGDQSRRILINETNLGKAVFSKSDKGTLLTLKFDQKTEANKEVWEGTSHKMKFWASLTFSKNATDKVMILGEEYPIYIPPAPTEFEMTKDVQQDRNHLIWTIEVRKNSGSGEVNLNKYEIEDDLTSAGIYVEGSLEILRPGDDNTYETTDDVWERITPTSTEERKVTLRLPDDYGYDYAKIRLRTKIDPAHLAKTPDRDYALVNTAYLKLDGETKARGDKQFNGKTKELIKKSSLELLDGKTTSVYDETAKTFTWYILGNKEQFDMVNGIIRDNLQSVLKLESFTMYKYKKDADKPTWIAKEYQSGAVTEWLPFDATKEEDMQKVTGTVAPTDGKYAFGKMEGQKIGLKIVAKPVNTLSNFEVVNWAQLFDREKPGTEFNYGESGNMVRLNTGGHSISKGPDEHTVTAKEQIKLGHLEWTVTVKKPPTDVDKLRMYEILNHQNFGSNTAPNVIRKENIKPLSLITDIPDIYFNESTLQTYGQRYVSAEVISGGSATIKKEEIYYKDGDNVKIGEIVRLSDFNFSSDEMKIKVITQIVSGNETIRSNGKRSFTNTAFLLKKDDELNSDKGTQEIPLYIMKKDVLHKNTIENYDKMIELVDTTPGYTVEKNDRRVASDVFNYNKNAMVYRLSINPSGVDFSSTGRDFWAFDSSVTSFKEGVVQGTNYAGLKKTGNFTFVDRLDPGWDFGSFDEAGGAKIILIRATDNKGQMALVGSDPASKIINDPEELNRIVSVVHTPGNNTKGGELTLTFKNLKESYVVLVKAVATEETLKKIESESTIYSTINRIFAYPANKMLHSSAENDLKIIIEKRKPLYKFYDEQLFREKKLVKWILDYDPKLEQSEIITDTLPEGLVLAPSKVLPSYQDNEGNIVFAIRKLKTDGSGFDENTSLITGDDDLQKYVEYNSDTRTITFKGYDKTKPHRFEFLTYATVENEKLTNTAMTKNKTMASGEVMIPGAGLTGSFLPYHPFKIKKSDRRRIGAQRSSIQLASRGEASSNLDNQ